MGELHKLPTSINTQQIAHLGTEHDPRTLQNAQLILRAGQPISMIGEGPSMTPVIEDGARMVIAPWEKGRRPKKYDVLFCRAGRGGHQLTTHLCWVVFRRKFIMIDTAGNVLGYIPFKYILGEYIGTWDHNKRELIPYIYSDYLRG